MKDKSLEGKRVVFTGFKVPDPWSTLRPGERGTVSVVDDMGTLHVDWDSGSGLGVMAGEYLVIQEE